MSEGPKPAADLDAAVRAHADRLPEPTRGLLLAAIAPDARDLWVRDALLAYCRLWIRRFDRDEPQEVTVEEMSCDFHDGITSSGGLAIALAERAVLATA